ncbi:MAG TPA: DnaJ domain-containing protein [Candidatus Blautia avicola]|uniref:DnaJ domain-containing protein n=1 Tax=Candidatus Blautia avicola TaxID=2838483 RepID=A0A9D2TZI2_9FIRM|nr:DnaJ domain-containing protein [Candidatus Blautia avicola]
MDKLTAQKILGVHPQASKREIKKAYAAMLRMYHPEDYPEEFQKIQEAYETLNKGGFPGEGSGNDGFSEGAFSENEGFRKKEEWQDEQEQKEESRGKQPGDDWEDAWESLDKDEEAWKRRQQEEQERRQQQEELRKRQQEEEYRRARQREEEYRRKIQEEEYRKAREELDFEKIEWKAREEKKLKDKALIAAALKDLELIVNTSSRRHRLKSYEEFFAKEEYKEVLFLPECVEGVCRILENTRLKREVYDIFAREYHMREYKPEQLKPGARKLYHILNEHCRFGKKRHRYQIGAGIFVAVLVLLRSLMRATDDNDWFYFLLVLVIAGLYWGYHWLLKYYSRWRIHIIYSLGITASQFIMLMTDAYTPLLGNRDAGEVFGAMVFLGGSLYFAVTLAAYILAGISHKIRRRKNK